jgi:hypothetical protein
MKFAATLPPSAVALSSCAQDSVRDAAATNVGAAVNLGKYTRVALDLWQSFMLGVHRWDKDKGQTTTVELDVYLRGEALSGGAVLANLDCFDDPKDLPPPGQTNRCAFACGWWAAQLASSNSNTVTAAIFQQAWCDTRETFGKLTCKPDQPPGAVDCGDGQNVGDQLPEDIKPGRLRILAYGCG